MNENSSGVDFERADVGTTDTYRNQRWGPLCNTFIHSAFVTEERQRKGESEVDAFLYQRTDVVTNEGGEWMNRWMRWGTAAEEEEDMEVMVVRKKAQINTAAWQ